MWKFCGKAQFPHGFGQIARNYAETVPFRKFFTPGNQVKLRYFSQCKLPNQLIIRLSRKFDATVNIRNNQNMMKELQLEIEAREKVGESRRRKVNRTSCETIEGLVATEKIVCSYCQ